MRLSEIELFGVKLTEFDFIEVSERSRIYYKPIKVKGYDFYRVGFVVVLMVSCLMDHEDDWHHEDTELHTSFYGEMDCNGIRMISLSEGDVPVLNDKELPEANELFDFRENSKVLLALGKFENMYHEIIKKLKKEVA